MLASMQAAGERSATAARAAVFAALDGEGERIATAATALREALVAPWGESPLVEAP
ncbi:hypothetical protein J7E96_13105 [Streptomyces sp. ISL-96]|uniref:hypothetical protein n=1 Tax=Streptomyces sp. ISL-96 TaxID=2819191 RepID=UPI001BE818BF|nr:hypothetical protein [Streptomyces sp. ISL-96]MBT2489441.1 hypothetical protein [Streptomyces sp. ISL-96]